MVNTSDILPNTPRYLKVPLIFFNAILWILGIILIALGGYALNELKNVKEIANITIPAGLIVLGVFIIILTVVGCVVAYKEKLVGLIFYTIIMLILLICLIGVGGGAFTYRNDAERPLAAAWTRATDAQRNVLQGYFVCCAWEETYSQPGSNCILNTTVVNGTKIIDVDESKPPCRVVVVPYVQDRLYVAGVAGVVIGVIEFVCMLFSLFLIVRLCRSPRSRSYD
jgi:hypothetical protein